MSPVCKPVRGFSFVELVAVIAIFGVAAVGVFGALQLGLTRQADGLKQAKVTHLAESYLERVMAHRFDELTPVGGVPPCSPCSPSAAFDDGEAEAQFDDVDDFDNLVHAPPRAIDGSVLSGYSEYRVEVDVDYLSPAQASALGVVALSIKRIEVAITPPGEAAQRFVALKANF